MRGGVFAPVGLASLLFAPAGGVLATASAALAYEPAEPSSTAASRQESAAEPEATGRDVPRADVLAPWRSPVDHHFLTEGEYLILEPRLRRRVDLDGDGRPELLVVVPFDATDGKPALSVAVLNRRGEGYTSRLLFNCYADELSDVRVVRLRGNGPPSILVAEQGGSGGFLAVHVFGWNGRRYRSLWSRGGIYQGRFRLVRAGARSAWRLEVTRGIQGDVDAYPKGLRRETYRWNGSQFALTSRARLSTRARVRLARSPHPLPRYRYVSPDE